MSHTTAKWGVGFKSLHMYLRYLTTSFDGTVRVWEAGSGKAKSKGCGTVLNFVDSMKLCLAEAAWQHSLAR